MKPSAKLNLLSIAILGMPIDNLIEKQFEASQMSGEELDKRIKDAKFNENDVNLRILLFEKFNRNREEK